ncbi:hypothetical protein CH367_04690 [Leptospira barantonii]|uniref:Uncharacterized protein n=1 Tax=Leptospira barantonii TaxID=2023184 RepID=A0ABX4NTY0_9LEPT|nr:hypothetical protein CH367_04690 [Leptospira barantonii]
MSSVNEKLIEADGLPTSKHSYVFWKTNATFQNIPLILPKRICDCKKIFTTKRNKRIGFLLKSEIQTRRDIMIKICLILISPKSEEFL